MNHSIAGTLTIALSAVVANYKLLADRAYPAQTAAAVKANAYGLGMAQIAPMLAKAGCSFFYVAHLDEALTLRQMLPDAAIAVLHGIPASEQALALRHNLIPVLCDMPAIHTWQDIAFKTEKQLPVIVHLDTGMNRLGLSGADMTELVQNPGWLAGLTIRYWQSHLACADDADHAMNATQLERLQAALNQLPKAPVSFANSSGIFLGPDYHFDQVRPGCALYGINPTPAKLNPMHAVASLTAPVLQLRPLLPEASVGYGARWRSKRAGRLAVLPVGYADGFLRSLSNRGVVYFGTHGAPVVGRVSMDLITVDVTDVPEELCQPGMVAELFGKQQDVDAVATAAGTIGYEILTNLGARYRRVYTS